MHISPTCINMLCVSDMHKHAYWIFHVSDMLGWQIVKYFMSPTCLVGNMLLLDGVVLSLLYTSLSHAPLSLSLIGMTVDKAYNCNCLHSIRGLH